MFRTLFMSAWVWAIALAPAHAANDLKRPEGLSEAQWKQLLAVDAKAAEVRDLTAAFVQQKHTPLLLEALESSGRVWAKPGRMLWRTEKPEPAAMLITEKEVRLHDPRRKTVEVYPIEARLAQVAATPLPRLKDLLQMFEIRWEPVQPEDLKGLKSDDEKPAPEQYIALSLRSRDEKTRQDMGDMRVLLEKHRGVVVRMTREDLDGERTVVTLRGAKINQDLTDEQLKLDPPAGTRVVRPLGETR